jgi:hypothetical protein
MEVQRRFSLIYCLYLQGITEFGLEVSAVYSTETLVARVFVKKLIVALLFRKFQELNGT